MRSFNNRKYIVYVYEFRDRHCYVGLTSVPNVRWHQHKQRGPVYRHSRICPESVYKILESELDSAGAASSEAKWQEHYRLAGWQALHTNKPGGLGGHRTWTKAIVGSQAAKFTAFEEWLEKCPASYFEAAQNDWLDELGSHMVGKHARIRRALKLRRTYPTVEIWSKVGGRLIPDVRHIGDGEVWYVQNGEVKVCPTLVSSTMQQELEQRQSELLWSLAQSK
jgi:hypothetical protein